MRGKSISRRSGWWIALAIVGAAIALLLVFMTGVALERYTASRAGVTSRALSATQAVAAYLTAQPTSTATPLPAATATPTPAPLPKATPDADATATGAAQSVADAVSATLAALPTVTATPFPTDTPLPAATHTPTPPPDAAATRLTFDRAVADAAAETLTAQPAATSTPTLMPSVTADAGVTARARLQAIADAVAETLTAQPTDTPTLMPSVTADAGATEQACLEAVADAVAATLTAQPTDTSTPTLTPSATPDAGATARARLQAIADAVAATLTAQPTDTSTPTPTPSATPDAGATEQACLEAVADAVAATLTAQPTDTSTPTPTLTATPDLGATRRAYLRDLRLAVAAALTAIPTGTPTVTPTATRGPDLKATELARRRAIDEAVALTLTAQPAPRCTPLLALPTLMLWGGRTAVPPDQPLVVPTDTPTQGCTDGAAFVADVTIPDGAEVTAGAPFEKTWRLSNAGTCAWTRGYQLQFASGERLGATAAVPLPLVPPGGVADVTVPLVAPAQPGAYRGVWQPVNASGVPFGLGVVVSIRVVPAVQPLPTISFSADPPVVDGGACTTLQWTADAARDVYLDGQPVDKKGRRQVCPCERTTYVLRAVGADGQTEDRTLVVEVRGACVTPTPTLPGEQIEFWADADVVDAGDCTALHWNVEGVRDVHLDGDGVVGAGSRTVCPCERETHVLRVTTRDGRTEERTVTVDVRGSCDTAEETVVEFGVGANSLQAGQCTELSWHVSGVKAVYLDDEPVTGDGAQEVCPCESVTYTLTVVYPDGLSRDFEVHVKVSGTCRSLAPGGLLRLATPGVPPLGLFIVPTPTLPTVE